MDLGVPPPIVVRGHSGGFECYGCKAWFPNYRNAKRLTLHCCCASVSGGGDEEEDGGAPPLEPEQLQDDDAGSFQSGDDGGFRRKLDPPVSVMCCCCSPQQTIMLLIICGAYEPYIITTGCRTERASTSRCCRVFSTHALFGQCNPSKSIPS